MKGSILWVTESCAAADPAVTSVTQSVFMAHFDPANNCCNSDDNLFKYDIIV